jgi:CubicO group peptidase (beta-lactamase class C family)
VSGGSRSLPSRPSLRFLRLEAKRRLAAGEFPSLHEAQAAIAREHGRSSWAALKQDCTQRSYALEQVHWLVSRFSTADGPGWMAPTDDELRLHVDDRLLAAAPDLVAQLSQAAADLRTELVVIGQRPLEAHVKLAGFRYLAVVDARPPYRLTALQGFPLAERITDPRVTGTAPVRTLGAVPAGVPGLADRAFAELGLVALVLAGGEPGRPPWVIAQGHADLDRAETLDLGHRFAAPGVTGLVTATAVLRLVAEGRLRLDAAAPLRTVRLADDTITVRELLSHTAGVGNPAEFYADTVPDLPTLLGPVVPCSGRRGVAQPSNGGYAVLGQVIADVMRMPYADAVTRLVLDPLGMRDSRFPARADQVGPGAVTGYTVAPPGVFVPFPAQISTVQAGSGPAGYLVGLGWLIGPGGDTAVHSGGGLDATAFLRVRVRDLRTHVVLTNRQIPLDSIDLTEATPA